MTPFPQPRAHPLHLLVTPRLPVMCASPARWRQRPRVSLFQFLTQDLLDFSSNTGCDQEILGNSFWYPEPHYESPPATWKHSDYSLLVAGEAVTAHRIVSPWTPPPFSPPSPAKVLIHTVTPAAGKLLALAGCPRDVENKTQELEEASLHPAVASSPPTTPPTPSYTCAIPHPQGFLERLGLSAGLAYIKT